MIQKLIDHLHSVFNRAETDTSTVFFCSHPDGFRWESDGRIFKAVTARGVSLVNLRLIGQDVEQVARALKAAGVTIEFLDEDMLGVSATGIRGDGGSLVSISRGVLHAIMDSYALELEEADRQIVEALEQMSMSTATGEWLDIWGNEVFSVPPEDGESDEDYRERIIAETLRPRLNPLAMERVLREITGKRIMIREPWKRMFVLGESAMSTVNALQDGVYYTYGVIQPVAATPVDWTRPMAVIERNRPAGTLIAAPGIEYPTIFTEARVATDSRVFFAQIDGRASDVYKAGDFVLGALRLSVDRPKANTTGARSILFSLDNERGIFPGAEFSRPRSVAKAGICLSDGARLGDVNSIFGLGRERIDPAEGRLDFVRLSDDVATIQRFVVEEVIDSRRFNETPPVSPAILSRADRIDSAAFTVHRSRRFALGDLRLSAGETNFADIGGRLDRLSASAASAIQAEQQFTYSDLHGYTVALAGGLASAASRFVLQSELVQVGVATLLQDLQRVDALAAQISAGVRDNAASAQRSNVLSEQVDFAAVSKIEPARHDELYASAEREQAQGDFAARLDAFATQLNAGIDPLSSAQQFDMFAFSTALESMSDASQDVLRTSLCVRAVYGYLWEGMWDTRTWVKPGDRFKIIHEMS